MPRRLTSLLVIAVLLEACAPTSLPGASRPVAPARAVASAQPTLAPAGNAGAPQGDLLRKPPTALRKLAGQLQLDARYAVGSGGGKVISRDGAAVLAMGPLKLDDAGRLVTNDGGSVVATGAGNFVSHNGAAALTTNNLVSQGGGNARYVLTDVPAVPPAGLVPAAGMVLEALALGSDKPLSLGVDAKGQPVYSVYSNAKGQFEVYLPADVSSNVHLHAHAPGTDPRLSYDGIATPASAEAVGIDEDEALVSRYLLVAFRSKLKLLLDAPNLDDPKFLAGLFDSTLATPELQSFVQAAAHAFKDRVVAAKVPNARYGPLATRAASAMLAAVDLDHIRVDTTNTHWDGSPDESAIDAMRKVFKQLRLDVARVLAEDPHYFEHQDYLMAANRTLAKDQAPYTVLKASDLGDFVVANYFSSIDPHQLTGAVAVFNGVASFERAPVAYKDLDHLFAATSGIAIALATAFVANDDGRKTVYMAIDAEAKAAP